MESTFPNDIGVDFYPLKEELKARRNHEQPKKEIVYKDIDEAIETLEVVIAMLSCLISNINNAGKALVVSWISNSETITLLLEIIDYSKKVKIEKIVGKLIIEITHKNACYSMESWKSVTQAIPNYFKNHSDFDGYMLAFMLRLALCCYHNLGKRSEAEVKEIRELWWVMLKALMLKYVSEEHKQYKELLILFLLQTLLKADKENCFDKVFVETLSQPDFPPCEHYVLFLKLTAVLPLEAESMKVCSEVLCSTLLKGTMPVIKLMNFSEIKVVEPFRKLITLLEGTEQRESIELNCFASLEEVGIDKDLLNQILRCPELIKYNEETKMTSTNYYLQNLLSLYKCDRTKVFDSLKKDVSAMIDYYVKINDESLSSLIYTQAILHSYMLFTEYLVNKKVQIGEVKDLVMFINMGFENAMNVIGNMVKYYFEICLNSRPELAALAGSFKYIVAMSPEIEKSFTNLNFSDLYSPYFDKVKTTQSLLNTLDSIKKAFDENMKDPSKSYESISQLMEAHFKTQLQDNTDMVGIWKTITSAMMLVQSFVKCAAAILKAEGNFSSVILQPLVMMEDFSITPNDRTEVGNLVTTFCKNVIPEHPTQLLKHVSELLLLSNISKSLKDLFSVYDQVADKTLVSKIVDIFLEPWQTYEKESEPVTTEIITITGRMMEYNLAKAVKDFAELLKTKNINAEISIKILTIINDLVKIKTESIEIIQKELLEMSNEFIESLLLKGADACRIFTELINGCAPLQQRIFAILVNILLHEKNENLIAYLELLTQVIESSRESCVSLLIEKLLPFVLNLADTNLQATLLNYLSSVCYLGMTIKYPFVSISEQVTSNPGENLIEGYGVENYVKKEEPSMVNLCCTIIKYKNKSESQAIYNCYTCNLTEYKVICSACAKVCHKNHKVAFIRFAQMTCCCKSEIECQAIPKSFGLFESENEMKFFTHYLKKQSPSSGGSEVIEGRLGAFLKFSDVTSRLREAEMKEDEDDSSQTDDMAEEKTHMEEVTTLISNRSEGQLSVSEHSFDEKMLSVSEVSLPPKDIPYEKSYSNTPTLEIKHRLNEKDSAFTQTSLAKLCKTLLTTKTSSLSKYFAESPSKQNVKKFVRSNQKLLALREKPILNSSSLAQLRYVFDITMTSNSSIKKHILSLSSDTISMCDAFVSQVPSAKSILATSPSGLIAVSFRDYISIHGSEAIINDTTLSSTNMFGSDKYKILPLTRIVMKFIVYNLQFNEANDSYLAACGMHNCAVIVLNSSTGQVLSKLEVKMMLQDRGEEFTISKMQWIPNSQTHLAIAFNLFVNIYDLSQDDILPVCILNSTQTIFKDMCVIEDAKLNFYRFFLISGNVVNTVAMEIPSRPRVNEETPEIQVVEIVQFPENAKSCITSSSLVSVYFAPISRFLFFTLANGRIVYGELDEKTAEMRAASVLRVGDSGSIKYFYQLQEIGANESEIWLCGMSMASQCQGVIIRVGEQESSIQILRQKIDGCFSLVSKKKYYRVLTPSEGYLGSFTPAMSSSSNKNTQLLEKAANHTKYLEVSHLPKLVTLPVDYFEKAINILDSSVGLAKKVKIGGTISLLLGGKDNVALLEWLIFGHGNNQFPVGVPPVTVEISLNDASNFVFAGVRIVAESAPKQFISIFNRKVPLEVAAKSVTEVGFCDAEILSIQNSKIKFKLEAEEVPIKLRVIEIFVFRKEDFEFEEKLEDLEQIILRKFSAKMVELGNFVSITSTKAYEVQSWDQKAYLIYKTIGNEDGLKSIINCLDFLSLVAYTSSPIKEEEVAEILSLLSQYIYFKVEDGIAIKVFRSAVRKCVKALLFNVNQGKERVEGDQFNYFTYKSISLFKQLSVRLEELLAFDELTFDYLEKCLKSVARLTMKAKLSFFERILENTDIIKKISALLINCIEKIINEDIPNYKIRIGKLIEHYLIIVTAYHDLLLNTEWKPNTQPHLLVQPIHLEQIAGLIKPYLFSKMEEVKSIFASSLFIILPKKDLEYIYTYQNPILKKYTWNLFTSKAKGTETGKPVELEVRLFDFSYTLGQILCKTMIGALVENVKSNVSTLATIRELFCNFSGLATHFKGIDEKSDEDWCVLFTSFVDCMLIKKNVTNPNDSSIIFTSLKLLNALLNRTPTETQVKTKVLELETAFRLLSHCYQHTSIICWITTSLKDLFDKFKVKKSAKEVSKETGKAQLLKVKPKFVKDSYQSSFMEEEPTKEAMEFTLFHELFKLCYNIASCEHIAVKAGMEGNILLKNSTEIEVLKALLCEALLTPGLVSGFDLFVKNLLKLLYKNKVELNRYRDNYAYVLSYKRLQEFIATKNETSFDYQIGIYNQLIAIWKLAKGRPTYWQAYMKSTPDMLKTLLSISTTSRDRLSFQALALICLALEHNDSSCFNIKTSYDIILRYQFHIVNMIEMLKYEFISSNDIGEGNVDTEIFIKGIEIAEKFLLESTSLRMRMVSAHLLKGLWDSGNATQRKQIFSIIAKKVNSEIHCYGSATFELLSLCLFILQSKEASTEAYSETILKRVIESAQKALTIVHTHEIADVYREVQGLMAVPSTSQDKESTSTNDDFLYCLQEIPCPICISNIGQEYSMQRISDVKADSTFTSSSYIYKLSSCYKIQKISVQFDCNNLRDSKVINLYTSTASDCEMSELKTNSSLWKKIGSLTLKKKSRSGILEPPIPITTNLLKAEFAPQASESYR